MKEEPINPGYTNPIFVLEDSKRTEFTISEFVNATVQDKGLNFDYEIDPLGEFIRLRITIKYIQSAKETGYDLEVIKFFRGFKVVKVVDIHPRELMIIFEHCISILNQELKEQSPTLKYLPKEFDMPVWENYHELLGDIAKKLNAC